MRTQGMWLTAALVGMAAASMPVTATAQDLRPESLKLYGGIYSPDCGNAAAPQVRIAADGLQISASGKNVRTPARMDSYTSFGGAPTSAVPEGYKVEFIGDDFSLYVFEDAKGTYVPLEGYVPSAAAIVGGAMQARFGRCGGS
ncbi:hypothetical protein MNR01_13605 [Lysobacter sp. S4-A87]|uniref:hypothetical protein n=1 Tax=Lysobacter sp. S4-A87 TaxID=2925843 RepID=UPI001F53263C|nr:hypothetical protein [Lysobacter sp. S4-A87]UNK48768.1 hypothetical protein MNR01_13605 [Lysobacter sp. S4-A87]